MLNFPVTLKLPFLEIIILHTDSQNEYISSLPYNDENDLDVDSVDRYTAL